jgi:hypothetical protein
LGVAATIQDGGIGFMVDSAANTEESPAKQIEKLTELEEVSTTPLLQIETVFPFRFFPCIVTLDRMKVTVIDQYFFFSKQIKTFLVKDIASVTVEDSWFFATFIMISVTPSPQKKIIPYLKKEDAYKLQRMIEGLLITNKENVDVLKIDDNSLAEKLEEIGRAET